MDFNSKSSFQSKVAKAGSLYANPFIINSRKLAPYTRIAQERPINSSTLKLMTSNCTFFGSKYLTELAVLDCAKVYCISKPFFRNNACNHLNVT